MARVIDGHTHAFPAEIVGDREGYCSRDGWFRQLYENPKAKLTGEIELLESMDRSGIDRAVIAGFPWADPGLCREHNAWMADVCRQHPERLSFLGIVVPHDRDAERDTAAALEAGAVGIGELNADAQRFQIENPLHTREVVDVCSSVGAPIMFHASEPVGHLYPGKGTATPEKLVAWLSAFPDQPAIFAHWGGGMPFYELMPEIGKLAANVVYDCAATTYLYDFTVFQTALGIVGPERIVFGSDFPVLGQERLLRRVRSIIDEPQVQAVLSENAERVFGLGGMRAS